MKAQELTSWRNMERVILHEAVPLIQPLCINIEPSSYCNLKCEFCIHSIDPVKKPQNGLDIGLMSKETFLTICDQLDAFPEPTKEIVFCGQGEPLLNKDLPWMIKQLKTRKLARTVALITNAVALTSSMADELIDSGLSSVRFSINGLSDQDYLKHTGSKVNFDKLVEQIAYFYRHKHSTTDVYCKLPEYILGEHQKDLFTNLFHDKCDFLSTHGISNWFREVSFEHLPLTKSLSAYQDVTHRVAVCALVFYKLNVWCDGKITLCAGCAGHSDKHFAPITFSEQKISEIWNGKIHRSLMLSCLAQEDQPVCKNCQVKFHAATPADILDPYANEIIARIKELK
jgi:sulfatase maturation enzyme AslB (radical SAM superfamily)